MTSRSVWGALLYLITMRLFKGEYTGHPSCLPETGKRKDSWRLPTGFFRLLVIGGGRNGGVFFPAAGNGNNASPNDRGSNGNYWSSSYNDSNNAYNLNFNSSNVNPQNNDNRRNGYSVRAVQHSSYE